MPNAAKVKRQSVGGTFDNGSYPITKLSGLDAEQSATGTWHSPDESTPLLNCGSVPKTGPTSGPEFSSTGDRLVSWDDFWDRKKGWMQFWNPQLTWHQITKRERDGGLYAFDAFRALAFLWVSNSHLQEGLNYYYDSTFTTWMNLQSKAITTSSANGVTVFMVISGFLNLMVVMSVSKKLKEKVLGWKTGRIFMFRRYLHLAPNLYLAVFIALLIGCMSQNSSLHNQFCQPCVNYGWANLVLLANFSSMMFGANCFNSTWTVSAQMQMYLAGIPVMMMYKQSPLMGFAGAFLAMVVALLIRTTVVLQEGIDMNYYFTYAYLPFYVRIDAYMLGFMTWMMYEQVLRPIITRSYAPKELRAAGYRTVPVVVGDSEAQNLSSVIENDGCVRKKERDVVDTPASASSNFAVPVASSKYSPSDSSMSGSALPVAEVTPEEVSGLFEQTMAYFVLRFEEVVFFHRHASATLKLLTWILYPLMAVLLYMAFLDVFSSPTYFWSSYVPSNALQYVTLSYGIFISGVGTVALSFFALEGSIFPPLKWFLSWYVWYPIGMLSYTSYLLSILTAFTFFNTVLDFHGDSEAEWTGGWFAYSGYYVLIVSINILAASVMSFVVERPLMNLSKAIEV